FFGWFNRTFESGNAKYRGIVSRMLARPGRSLAVYAAITGVMLVLFMRLPTSFLPDEDQGVLFVQVQAPVGATQERTMRVMEQIEEYFLNHEKEAVESIFTVQGFSFGGAGQNTGIAFVKMRDWDERPSEELGVQAVAMRAMGALSQIKDALVFAFPPPPVPELGRAQGFAFYLQDNLGRGHDALMAARNQLLAAANQSPLLVNVRPNGVAGGALVREVARRLDRSRTRQAGVRAGRCAVPHAAGGFRSLVRAQSGWRDGALLGLLHRALGLWLAAARALQRRLGGRDQW